MDALLRKPDTAYLGNWLWVPKHYIDADGMKNALTMRFVDNYSESKVRFVYLWRETETHLLVPRCLWKPSQLPFRVVDVRPTEYTKAGLVSHIKLDHRRVNGELRPTGGDIQQRVMEALRKADSGLLQLGCGVGKTVIALHFAAEQDGPTLVLLDNTNLLEQWRLQAEALLTVPGGIGLIQGDTFDWKKGLVLATYHTMGALARDLPEEVKRWFKLIIFDEGHHISASTFAPCAEVFYGFRLALSATPIRADGTHVIYDNHVGPVIYKDVTHVIKPRIIFKWTGLEIEPTANVYDKNEEVHLSKLAVHFGKWKKRMAMILDDVEKAISYGRKVLVLCDSVDETINLCALWTQRNWNNPSGLYTDIPIPTPNDVGETVHPIPLDSDQRLFAEKQLEKIRKSITELSYDTRQADEKYRQLRMQEAEFELQLKQDDIHKLIKSKLTARQAEYRKWLTGNLRDAGLMIHKIKPEERMEYVKTKRVIFAITKYGKEGLDDEYLDTVLISKPFSSRNGLQQTMGRPTRQKPGKKSPLIVIYEDNIGPLIGSCKKLRSHLSSWPLDESGPFEFEMHDHPRAVGRSYRPIFEDIT